MRIELAISFRYFRSRRAEGALSFITLVAIGGVTLGVGALVVAMSVMNGYESNLIRAMAGALPHVSLHPLASEGLPERATFDPLVRERLHPTTLSPYVLYETLLSGPHSGVGGVQGVLVRAIDPAEESRVPDLLAFLADGSAGWADLPSHERQQRARRLLLSLREIPTPGVARVLLSPLLAGKLGAGQGDRLIPLVFPREGEGFSPHPSPRRLEIAGYFSTGIVAFDELVVLMDVGQIADIFPEHEHHPALGMRLADPLQAGAAAAWLRGEMRSRDRPVFVYSWLESNRGLFRVIRVQKTMLFLVLMLIVLLAFFGMVSALVMLVAEKTREIAILKSLGVRNRSIYRIFLMQGLLVGLLGTVLGLGLGLGVCWVLDTFPVFAIPPGVYPGSDRVPVRVAALDLMWVVLATFATCLAATLFPARKAMALRPVEGLRAG